MVADPLGVAEGLRHDLDRCRVGGGDPICKQRYVERQRYQDAKRARDALCLIDSLLESSPQTNMGGNGPVVTEQPREADAVGRVVLQQPLQGGDDVRTLRRQSQELVVDGNGIHPAFRVIGE